ncbi:DUF3089 domain-containing protein [Sediminibacterium goheungense]|uniref:DUF3089 family protein n=1 Tax=Sediminibacterium goheungense TaxID=1086393 RepID=A0A4R6IVE2_9BACT|nr:DUF3089 domain-containing protein [Sediminibacterium goheungense]TDO26317.1 Protein of unknown function (DUF3089) [Sediminibacterium goheungense]
MKYTRFASLILILLYGCSNGYHKFESQYALPSSVPDYGNLEYWAAHPYKKDPSDSIPRPLRKMYLADSSIDIFFIHPTTYTDNARPFGWNAPIENAALAAKTDYSTILYQASIFNASGRIFAPRYRQANLGAYFPVTAADTVAALQAFEIAYADVKAAFSYYLSHYNNGRPIIIATHSQGTTHGKRLVKEFFDGTALQKKLVAAYLVGIPVEKNWFTQLKACETANETGCILSWRTFKEGYKPDYVLHEKVPAIVTNPLTWSRTDTIAPRKINMGSVVTGFNSLVKKVAEANNAGGVIWTPKPRFFGNIFFTTKNYHIGDYNLYYLSVRENVKERIKAYKNGSPD